MSEKEVIFLERLDVYNLNVPWMIYVEKIYFYLYANNIKDDEKKKNILLSWNFNILNSDIYNCAKYA